ncbi:MAG: sugar transferase [Parcubacteria group bacterium GW2011_GWA1_47_8]|nr:MAG: sugar transferase [Parcubacteria group bacterium GW2011_GWA1_47_8]
MTIGSKRERSILFVGDLLSFVVAFWCALVIRYVEFPSLALLEAYLLPLSVLFLIWVFVFFIAGLYERYTLVFRKRLPETILNAQITNSLIAVVFFYILAPYVAIAPKTILGLQLILSFSLVVVWRVYGPSVFGARRQESAILIGAGEEMQNLKEAVNRNGRYNLSFVSSVDLSHIEQIDFKTEIIDRIYGEKISTVVIDLRNEKADLILPALYNLIFSKVRFLDMHKVYEEIFERIPLSLVKYNWFLENISSTSSHLGYDILKRTMDLVIAIMLGVVSLLLYPFVALSIKFDDGGPVFIKQDRIGRNNVIVKILKFRSMAATPSGARVITHAGKFLRALRIDELPQLWNVIRGDLSLVGPRPELPELVKVYEKEIPYYNARHLVTPGLSGWGQIKDYNVPRSTADVDKTRTKLSYDLFYIKNRSFTLDLAIALKTIKTLLSRSGN